MKDTLNKTGFTLIEIMVVISIIGIIASIAFLSFSKPSREAALDNSYANVITAFESARNRAMHGAGDGSGGQAVSISGDGRSLITETGTIPLPFNISIDQTGQTVEFQRISGEATDGSSNLSSPITFTLTDSEGNTRTATVTPEGFIYHE